MKIAQHFSGGWVGERRDRPARDDRIVFCLLNPSLQEQTKLEPKSERYAGRFYRPYRDGTLINRFHTQPRTLSGLGYFRCVPPGPICARIITRAWSQVLCSRASGGRRTGLALWLNF